MDLRGFVRRSFAALSLVPVGGLLSIPIQTAADNHIKLYRILTL